MPLFSGFSFFIIAVLFIAWDIVCSAGIIYSLVSSTSYPMLLLKLSFVGIIAVAVFDMAKPGIIRWLSN